MLRRKAKWTIDNLSDSSMSISIKSKKKYINTIPKRTWSSNCIKSISSIGNVNAVLVNGPCRQMRRRSNYKVPISILGGK